MTQESQTVDEGYHLLAGYQFLKTGGLPANSSKRRWRRLLQRCPCCRWTCASPMSGRRIRTTTNGVKYDFFMRMVN
jgi:hypothetical protein